MDNNRFCRWTPHNLTDHQKEEHVRISERIISKIVTDDEAYIPFIDDSTSRVSKVCVFQDDPTPSMVKRQRTMKEAMYAAFFKTILTVEFVKQKQIKVREHSPYFSDLAKCDFCGVSQISERPSYKEHELIARRYVENTPNSVPLLWLYILNVDYQIPDVPVGNT
ncbi:UNVERIFIED_CONTAM: hypothetical protein NCL1_33843 [Trichonephila clavipes]